MKLWPRVRLQIGWRDLCAGALACVGSANRTRQANQIANYWPNETPLVSYSVRSGFDLLLQALELQTGDEVIYSALNVKGMISIARRAGLVAVPLDLDLETFAPKAETLQRAMTGKSKVLVIAHLFGCRLELDALINVAHQAGLIVVEDCAQAFNGAAYSGHPRADVSMFSFGPLKTSTALGGALINVRDDRLRVIMRAIQATYPVQPTVRQAKRILQFAGLKLITAPYSFGALQRCFALAGRDYEDAIADRVRSVAVLKTTNNLRFQPSAALLSLLCRRLTSFDSRSIDNRKAKAARLKQKLDGLLVLPGQENRHHDYWVFPAIVDHPAAFVSKLRSKGFDAAGLPRSQAVCAPDDRPELEPVVAAQALSKLVVLPCYESMPNQEIDRLANVARRAATDTSLAAAVGNPSDHDRSVPWWHAGRLRKARRHLIKTFGKRFIRRLASFLAGQSMVSNAPTLDPAQFGFLKDIADNWRDIDAELQQILKHKHCVPAFEDVSADQARIARGRQWRTFILYGFGDKLKKNCSHAERAAQLLEKVPNLQSAWFSILEPGYHIPAHTGITKGILRCHLGLEIPDDSDNCWMRVGQDKLIWRAGELLVFDDTYEHEVRNDTSQQRVVLLFDFERPMRFWGRIVNRAFIKMIKLTAYYREPKAKMKSFEERFETATRSADKLLEELKA